MKLLRDWFKQLVNDCLSDVCNIDLKCSITPGCCRSDFIKGTGPMLFWNADDMNVCDLLADMDYFVVVHQNALKYVVKH